MSLELRAMMAALKEIPKADNEVFERVQRDFRNETGGVLPDDTLLLLCSIPYSVKFSQITDGFTPKTMGAAMNAFSMSRQFLVDLCNPATTMSCHTLAFQHLVRARERLNLNVEPFPDPHDDIKVMINSSSPFKIVCGNIVPYDPEATFLENVWRQSTGIKGDGLRPAMLMTPFYKFAFKNFVELSIPLTRVCNGASTCYCDPYAQLFYVTGLIVKDHTFKILRNLIIYERQNDRGCYIESAVKYLRSMCTDAEDFKLMQEYGVLDVFDETYEEFIEKLRSLDDVMTNFVISSYWRWHFDLIKIANYKRFENDTSDFKTYAKKCYNGQLNLPATLDRHAYKNLNQP